MKKHPPRPTNREIPDYTNPPPDAVWYHGFLLPPDALERFKDIEEFHRVHGEKATYAPDWRKNEQS